jgi:cold shock protein
MKGIIKVLKEGFGFIKGEGEGGDVFFHANNLEGVAFNDLQEGMELSFEIGDGKNGKKQAVNVQVA